MIERQKLNEKIFRYSCFICLMVAIVVFICSCAHTSIKQEDLQIKVFKDEETEKRVKYLQDRLAVDSDNPEYRIELGKIFLSEGMIDDAITELEKALEKKPDNIEIYFLLSSAYQKLPKPDLKKTLALLTKALEIEPDNANIHLNLAKVYEKLKNKDEAINEYKKTIELSNETTTLVSAHLGLMDIYKRQGQFEEANREYKEALKIYPDAEEIVKQSEINRVMPTPYTDEDSKNENDRHPPLEVRIIKTREAIKKLSGEEK